MVADEGSMVVERIANVQAMLRYDQSDFHRQVVVLVSIISVKDGMTYPQMSLRIGNLEGVKEFVNIQSDDKIVVSSQDISFLGS